MFACHESQASVHENRGSFCRGVAVGTSLSLIICEVLIHMTQFTGFKISQSPGQEWNWALLPNALCPIEENKCHHSALRDYCRQISQMQDYTVE